jgi:hypothetical protein
MTADETTDRNLLVFAPAMGDAKERLCHDLLGTAPPASLDVLQVSYTRPPDRLVATWRERHDSLPAHYRIVDVGARARAPGRGETDRTPASVTVTRANPNDLTGLAMEWRNAFNEFARTDNDLVVCLDSITAMLQYVSVEEAYRFVHMATGQVHELAGQAHFHLDPQAHDDQTISTMKTAFDGLHEADE